MACLKPDMTLWQNQVSEVESILTVDEKEKPGAHKCWCLLSSKEKGVICLDPYLEVGDRAFESPTLPVFPCAFALLSGPQAVPILPVSAVLKVGK